MYNFNVKEHTEKCIQWIKDWFDTNGKGCNAVIGMSGGKDSTIVAKLCVEALGADRVIGVAMPDSGQGINDADKICKYLGIKYMYMPIGPITGAFNINWVEMFGEDGQVWFEEKIPDNDDFTWSEQSIQNIPPRVRMTMLYAIAQTYNGRVANTCNLSEDYVGYMTLYGDGAGSFSPLAKLTVTEILAIGDYLNIPNEWVHKTPDDGLPHSSPDEAKFGFTYAELDQFIRTAVEPEGMANDTETKYAKIRRMHKQNLFKLDILSIPSYEPNLHVYYI